jgi:hypothetical protein
VIERQEWTPTRNLHVMTCDGCKMQKRLVAADDSELERHLTLLGWTISFDGQRHRCGGCKDNEGPY